MSSTFFADLYIATCYHNVWSDLDHVQLFLLSSSIFFSIFYFHYYFAWLSSKCSYMQYDDVPNSTSHLRRRGVFQLVSISFCFSSIELWDSDSTNKNNQVTLGLRSRPITRISSVNQMMKLWILHNYGSHQHFFLNRCANSYFKNVFFALAIEPIHHDWIQPGSSSMPMTCNSPTDNHLFQMLLTLSWNWKETTQFS